jgi:hypothetical protein
MKHMIIPDTQIKPGVPTDHMMWAGKYAVDKKPDVIVHLGDHWDMEALCSFDRGKMSFEGRSYKRDIKAGNDAMLKFMAPIWEYNVKQKRNGKKQYRPRMVFTLGNHEYRIERAIEESRELEDLIGYHDFNLDDCGWEVHDFKEVVVIDGVAYAHYFVSGIMGRPVSSARLMLNKKHMSCVMGHVQDRDIAFAKRADGTSMTGIFAGVFNEHEEDYLGAQNNDNWRGIWMLHEVKDGAFDEMPVSLRYLKEKYA